MANVHSLLTACQIEPEGVSELTLTRIALWDNWLIPISPDNPAGNDPGYDDDFQQMRDEVNKLSGADTEQVCALAEKLLSTTAKDIRIVTYYIWARLQRDGENGFADGLELLVGLLQRYGKSLHPRRERSRKAALEWMCSPRMLDSLSLFPEVNKEVNHRIVCALWHAENACADDDDTVRPILAPLYLALESRLMKAGGIDAIVPLNVADSPPQAPGQSAPELNTITSAQDLLSQARILAKYLRDQPGGWLSGHHLMKSIRHDTLHQLPPLSADGRTRIEPPKPEQRATLKRLYLQQSWLELLDRSDGMFTRGANHLWLDLQWYIHQALIKSGQNGQAGIIQDDLKGLLSRLTGLETLAFNDGTPFADEVTLTWIREQVMDNGQLWKEEACVPPAAVSGNNNLQALETEALKIADSEDVDAALSWLQGQPGHNSLRENWLLRLLMARVAEQTGKNDIALCLLSELDDRAGTLTVTQWEPELLFEVKARRLKLLRAKAGRSESDKHRLAQQMEMLLSGLIQLDPARAVVLCS